MPAANATTAVLGHEAEHVSAENTKARQDGGRVVSSTVNVEYACCPDCGRRYVAGGTTKTVVQKPSSLLDAKG